MKLRVIAVLLTLVLAVGCKPSGVKKKDTETKEVIESTNGQKPLEEVAEVVDKVTMENGIVIQWFEHGTGDKLKNGELVSIDYKVSLTDGKVVDGNHLLKKESMPFMIGFQMQTKGWDIALKELQVGDFAEIFIPSDLARGEKGIKGLIPANADNILRIRILEKKKPTREVDGNKVWVFEENEKSTKLFSEKNEIQFHCMVSSPSNPMYVNTYRENKPFDLKLEDSGTVPGLKKALINAKKSDRMFVLVPASEAYGSKGLLDLVKPNEDLFYNILVMDVTDK